MLEARFVADKFEEIVNELYVSLRAEVRQMNPIVSGVDVLDVVGEPDVVQRQLFQELEGVIQGPLDFDWVRGPEEWGDHAKGNPAIGLIHLVNQLEDAINILGPSSKIRK